MTWSQPPPAPCFKGLPSKSLFVPWPSGQALGAARAGGTDPTHSGKWERPDGSPLTRDHSYSHSQTFTIRRAVCKTQRQPNEKHIVSQKKLGGEERAAQHPAALGRASKPEGRRSASFSAHPLQPPFPVPLPQQQGPQAFAFSPRVGRVIWEPDVELQPLQGRGAEGERWRMALGTKQTDTLEFGLHHSHMSCASLGEFLDLSEPFCQHRQAEGLSED